MKILLRNAAAPGGLFFEIERFPFLIGRSHWADGPLPLSFISRSHCRFYLRDGEFVVEDLDSANGTYVNRQRIYPGQKKPLNPNDVVQIGNVQLKVLV